MDNIHKEKKVACCTSIATQHATFTDFNATTSATYNATTRLKALAGEVLRRNTARNSNAAESEKQRNFYHEKGHEKLHKVASEIASQVAVENTINILARDPFDDRNHCRDCQKLINGRCLVDRIKPIDDIPRRCEWFVGYPVREGLK